MVEVRRMATVGWQGDLTTGRGRLTTGSGTATGTSLSWDRRTGPGDPVGGTSPEELIAAAHAGCYSMSLANVLAARRTPHEGLDVSAQCVADTGPDGFAVTAVELEVRARVPGLDAATFAELAREAEHLCPVSRLMRGNVEVRLRATLL